MKRFTDTNLNREPWFRKLKPRLKCAVRFLFDECDNAGIWVIDMETLTYFIGEEVGLDELLMTVNSDKVDRIELIREGKLFIPGFIDFQYGELSEYCKPHQKVISILKKYGLLERVYKGYSKGISTLQEEEVDKEEDKEEDGKGAGGKPAKRPLKKAAEQVRQTELKAGYKTMQEEWEGKPDKEVFGEIKKFVEEEKPAFPEPYVDAWNIFAPWYGLEEVRDITDDRRDKVRIRTREPSFDFFKLLAVIRKEKWLTGDNNNGWKITFNYLIESPKKYMPIIEKFKETA